MRSHARVLAVLTSALCTFMCATSSFAQGYPTKTIKIIVPFPPGGPADTFGRVIGEKVAADVGQPVIIENRAGAGGVTGSALVAKAEPDGYTIGITTAGALAISVSLQEKMPYNPLTDLTLLTQAVSVPELLVIAPTIPAKTLAELVGLAKAQPGKLNFASTGLGSMPHLAGELFKIAAGIDIVHVPYPGAAPATNDVLGGHVQMLFADVPVLLGNVQSGKLKALAVGSKARIATLPDVPTTAEQGLPAVEADNWYGMFAPPNLPAAVDTKLQSMLVSAIKSQEVTAKLAAQGAITVGNSRAEFQSYVKDEIAKWGRVIKTAGIKVN